MRRSLVQQAIEKERERCAKIAEQEIVVRRQSGGIFDYDGPTWYDERRSKWQDGTEIAAAIRAGKK